MGSFLMRTAEEVDKPLWGRMQMGRIFGGDEQDGDESLKGWAGMGTSLSILYSNILLRRCS